MRVLIVEDNEDVAMVIKKLVDRCGHRPWVAYEGWSAIAIARHMHPDFVLTDIAMPGMDGYEFASKLRELVGTETPIYAVSASPDDENKRNDSGINGHLQKPVSLQVLQELLCTA